MTVHFIPPGLYCVPAAIYAITGADIQSVIVPAINRHSNYKLGLLDTVAGIHRPVTKAVLEELGYNVRPYKHNATSGQLRAQVFTWAERSKAWPDRAVLIAVGGRNPHCMVICNGQVYDNWAPFGNKGAHHPFSRSIVEWAALVEKK